MAKPTRSQKTVRPQYLFLLSLILGWIFDFLFWKKQIGVSLPIFTLLVIAVGLWLAVRARLKPARNSLWLLVPIAFFALVPVFRLEPFTRFTSAVVLILLLAVFALSFLGGQWTRYGFVDYIAKILGLVPTGLGLLRQPDSSPAKKQSGFSLRSLAPVGRGLLFVLPLLWFLAVLLASADPAFEDWLNSVFSFLKIDNAAEYLFRGFYILILAYVLVATYLVAFNKSRKQTVLGEDKPLFSRFLGFGEAATMLTAVNVLFAAFVVFQFNYFFGGTSNIIDTPTGFTYSQYAVRGFWELVIVSMTSLVFFIAMSTVSKRDTARKQRWFSGLGITLFALVAVILTSAFERLLLYERVYGFTRLRTYPHVFMIWLGVLLLAIVILEALGRQRAFALATALAVLGFTATLALINVDGMIARENIELIYAGQDFHASDPDRWTTSLDYAYLGTLSDDAVPFLVSAYQESKVNGITPLSERIAVALTCHFEVINSSEPAAWQSWNLSRTTASTLWQDLKSQADFPLVDITDRWAYVLGDEEFSCYGQFWD
jgi:hypothetical protein